MAPRDRPSSLWIVALLGGSAGALLGGVASTPSPGARADPRPLPAGGVGLEGLSPLELARLPGLGRSRSLAVARERWDARGREGGATLTGIRGIGPATEARVRAALEALGRAPSCSAGSVGTEGGRVEVLCPHAGAVPEARAAAHDADPRRAYTRPVPAAPPPGCPPVLKPTPPPPSPALAGRIGLPPPLEPASIDAVVRPALEEDLGGGDVTTLNAVPAGVRARGRLVAKQAGRLAGLAVFARVFELLDPATRVELLARDGDDVAPGTEVARVEGEARVLLQGERTALNLVQRMSGIATLTAEYVRRARGGARVLDTRKTTPNLRALEKYAVRCGGGENHRFGLFDEAMVKDNHADLAGSALPDVVRAVRAAVGEGVRITCEARDEDEALAAIDGGADVVLLDNMTVETLRELCPRLRAAASARGRPVELEASGGIDLETVGGVAASGVDRVSVGALTHSAPALDLSLKIAPLPGGAR